MSIILCNVPFCKNNRPKFSSYCNLHRYENRKFPKFKKVLPYWIGIDCDKHGLQPISKCLVHYRNDKNYYSCNECQKIRDSKRIRTYDQMRNWQLKTHYNLTLDEYNSLCSIQNNLCKICNKRELNKNLSVDHCHKTKKIRGLLCSNCNLALGFFKDSKENLERAIIYL